MNTSEIIVRTVVTTTPEFVSWLEGVRKVYNDYMQAQFPNNPRETIEVSEGARYIKLIRVTKHIDTTVPNPVEKVVNRSVHAFLDRRTGDVLKPASWNAPAKNARGNIFNADNGLSCISAYGPAYMRDLKA